MEFNDSVLLNCLWLCLRAYGFGSLLNLGFTCFDCFSLIIATRLFVCVNLGFVVLWLRTAFGCYLDCCELVHLGLVVLMLGGCGCIWVLELLLIYGLNVYAFVCICAFWLLTYLDLCLWVC